jgi:hypothetical protein
MGPKPTKLQCDERPVIAKIHDAVDRGMPKHDSFVITENHFLCRPNRRLRAAHAVVLDRHYEATVRRRAVTGAVRETVQLSRPRRRSEHGARQPAPARQRARERRF